METFESVAHSRDTAYVLSADWRLLRINDGWKRFALENGGASVLERWPQGSSIQGVIGAALWEFYQTVFDRVHATGQHFEHDYECSSPELYRLMHMVVYPHEAGSVLVVSSPTIECRHDDGVQAFRLADYEHHGVVVTCSHCRRFRNPMRDGAWDWIPELVRNPPARASHGLCPTCFEHYYPE